MTIAACVPSRNRSHYLALSLQSILEQTRRPDRVVISDDASTDGTPQVVADYTARFQAAGVEVAYSRHDPPLGQEGNRRFAFQQGGCEYLAMLDDDDLWRPEFIERLASALSGSPEAAFATCGFEIIDGNGQRVDAWTRHEDAKSGRLTMVPGLHRDLLPVLLPRRPFGLGAGLFRQPALEAVGFIPAGAGNFADLALYCALALRGYATVFDPAPLWRYRAHDQGREADLAETEIWSRELIGVTEMLVREAVAPRDKVILSRSCMLAHRDLVMNLAHAGHRAAAVAEIGPFVRRWGVRALGRRLLVYLPLVLLGADRLRHGRPLPKHG